MTPPESVAEFLSSKRVAVIGVSRSSSQPANLIYRTLRSRRYEVLAAGCPMMFSEPVDSGHRCMRWILGFSGRLPS